jgi:hypothetical protein
VFACVIFKTSLVNKSPTFFCKYIKSPNGATIYCVGSSYSLTASSELVQITRNNSKVIRNLMEGSLNNEFWGKRLLFSGIKLLTRTHFLPTCNLTFYFIKELYFPAEGLSGAPLKGTESRGFFTSLSFFQNQFLDIRTVILQLFFKKSRIYSFLSICSGGPNQSFYL